jgi:calcineurin-like phosphoesterase family protein
MNEKIIENWNCLVTKDDVVFHLGDFCFGSYKPFQDRLYGKIIFIKGNHVPPETLYAVPDFTDIVLCGHIHEKWAFKVLDHPDIINKSVPMINVGIDVNNFKPVLLSNIIKKGFKNE